MAKFTLTGIKGVDRVLKKLPDVVAKKVLRKAIRESMRPMQARVKALAPVHTGATKKGVKLRAVKYSRKGNIGIDVRISGAEEGNDYSGKQFYAAFVEYGHWLGKRTSKAKKGTKTGAQGRTRFIEGKHFMERAFNETKDSARTTAERLILDGMLAAAESLKAGG